MAREKTEKVVFTFHTTTMAMRMEQCAKDSGCQGRLIPVPRQISAGCGMAFCAPAADRIRLVFPFYWMVITAFKTQKESMIFFYKAILRWNVKAGGKDGREL